MARNCFDILLLEPGFDDEQEYVSWLTEQLRHGGGITTADFYLSEFTVDATTQDKIDAVVALRRAREHMTPEQAAEARAALGCGHGPRTLWNFRSLRPTNPVWPLWQAMVVAGLATIEQTGSAWCPDLHAFRLTQAAAQSVLLPGEVLDDKTVWGVL